MISLLSDLLEVFEFIPEYILYALESMLNLFFTAVEGVLNAALSLLPSLPSVEPPAFLTDINWFFPLGAILSFGTPVLAAYVVFFSVRWIFQKIGDL